MDACPQPKRQTGHSLSKVLFTHKLKVGIGFGGKEYPNEPLKQLIVTHILSAQLANSSGTYIMTSKSRTSMTTNDRRLRIANSCPSRVGTRDVYQ